MPKYSFQCDKCGRILTEIRPTSERNEVKTCFDQIRIEEDSFRLCSGLLKKTLSRVSEPSIMETVDRDRNVQWRKDQDRRIKKRAKDFFRKNEMEDAIAKVGAEEARRYGWVDKYGKKNKAD